MDKLQVIKTGAKWWADTLRFPPEVNSGGKFQNIMIEWARNHIPAPTKMQIDEFQKYLEKELSQLLEIRHWVKETPSWGSYFREIGVDWEPDKYLGAAAQKAGVNTLWFPIKTFMRLDPDGVKVSVGYRGQPEMITE